MARKMVLEIEVDDKGNVAIQRLIKNIGKAQKSVSTFGSVFRGILASQVVFRSVRLLTQSFAHLSNEVLEFNKIFKQTQGITQATDENIEALKDKVLELSNATELTAVNLAKAALQLSKMGIQNTAEQLNILPVVANLATSSVVELEEAILVAGQVTRSFGLDMKEIGRVANVIQTTVSSTTNSFEDYKEAMKFIAPIAKSLGIEIEEASALVGGLGDMGIRASLGGTSLKNTMLQMLRPTDAVAKALNKMNTENMTLVDILAGLDKQGISTLEFLKTFNLRALAGVLGLSKVSDKVNELNKNLVDQKVKVKDVAEVIRGSWIDQMSKLRNLLVNTAIEFSRAFETVNTAGAFQSIADFMVNLQKKIRDNRDEIREFTQSVVDLVVKGFQFVIDHKDAFLLVFKFFIVQNIASKLERLTLLIYDLGKAFKFASIQGNKLVNTGPKIDRVTSYVNTLTLAVWAGVEAYNAITDAADRLTEKSEKSVKAAMDFTESGINTKINALKQLQDEVAKWDRSLVELNIFGKMTSGEAISLAQKAKVKQFIGLEISEKESYALTYLKAAQQWDIAVEKLMKSTGLSMTFFQANNTLDKMNLTLKGLEALKAKLPKSSKDEGDYTPTKRGLPGGVLGRDLPVSTESEKKRDKSEMNRLINNPDWGQRLLKQMDGTGLPIFIKNWDSKLMSQFYDPIIGKEFQLPTGGAASRISQEMWENMMTQFPTLRDALNDNTLAIQGIGPEGITGNFVARATPSIVAGLGQQYSQLDIDVFEDIKNKAQKDFNEMQTIMQEFFADSDKFMSDFTTKMANYIQENFMNITDSILSTTNSLIGAIDNLYNVHAQNSKKRHDEEVSRLEEWKEKSISTAGDSAKAKARINREYEKKMDVLKKEQEARDREEARRRKAVAIIQSIINTALAATNALATVAYPANLVAMASVIALGGIQTAAIAAQEFLFGGVPDFSKIDRMVVGGSRNVDSVPAILSKGERVLSSGTVDDLGGQEGVDMLIDSEQFGRRARGWSIYNIYNPIGTEEYVRELFTIMDEQNSRRNFRSF